MRLSAFLLAAAVTASPLAAQDAGSVELGGYALFSGLNEKSTLDGHGGIGASLGYFLFENFSLEGAAGYNWTSDRAPRTDDGAWVPIRGRLLYGISVRERVIPFIGASVVHNLYDGVVDDADTGVGGIAGIRLGITDDLSLRADLSVDHMWAPYNEGDLVGEDIVESNTNWMISTGLSYTFGGSPRDSDGDGVPDRDDTCAATPLGVMVDAAGCRVDSDSDGVFEEADRCAGTPSGVRVDAMGCRVDADGDGVFDEDDACADTPSGVRVDARGCRVDTDGDGVFDEDDACADTPSGVRVDGRGCRVDTDGDGVFDEDDRCANSPRGEAVDAAGCPVLFEDEDTPLVLEGVTFETSSAELTADARVVLDRVAQALVGNPDVRVRVAGHTDASGSRLFNVDLSQARAESVVAYLAQRGVDAGRMEARGFGPDQPIADNSTPAGRETNRRVELERIGG